MTKSYLLNHPDDLISFLNYKTFFHANQINSQAPLLSHTEYSLDLKSILVPRQYFSKSLINLLQKNHSDLHKVIWPTDKFLSHLLSNNSSKRILRNTIQEFTFIQSCSLQVNEQQKILKIELNTNNKLNSSQKQWLSLLFKNSPFKDYSLECSTNNVATNFNVESSSLISTQLQIKQQIYSLLSLRAKDVIIDSFYIDPNSTMLQVQVFLNTTLFKNGLLTSTRESRYVQKIQKVLSKFNIKKYTINIQSIPLNQHSLRYKSTQNVYIRKFEAKLLTYGVLLGILAILILAYRQYRIFKESRVFEIKNVIQQGVYINFEECHGNKEASLKNILKFIPDKEEFTNHKNYVQQIIYHYSSIFIQSLLNEGTIQISRPKRFSKNINFSQTCKFCNQEVYTFHHDKESLTCPQCNSTYILTNTNLLLISGGESCTQRLRLISLFWIFIFLFPNISIYLYLSFNFDYFCYSIPLQLFSYTCCFIFGLGNLFSLPIIYLYPNNVQRKTFTRSELKTSLYLILIIISSLKFFGSILSILVDQT